MQRHAGTPIAKWSREHDWPSQHSPIHLYHTSVTSANRAYTLEASCIMGQYVLRRFGLRIAIGATLKIALQPSQWNHSSGIPDQGSRGRPGRAPIRTRAIRLAGSYASVPTHTGNTFFSAKFYKPEQQPGYSSSRQRRIASHQQERRPQKAPQRQPCPHNAAG